MGKVTVTLTVLVDRQFSASRLATPEPPSARNAMGLWRDDAPGSDYVALAPLNAVVRITAIVAALQSSS